MEFEKFIPVKASAETVWPFVKDVPSVISCFPGAELSEIGPSGEFVGSIRVKVGPFSPQFRGTAAVVECDDVNHRIVVRAKGADRKIGSNVSVLITITLASDSPATTTVRTLTDLQLTGRLAQFGKGIFEAVADRLVTAFAERVNRRFQQKAQGS